MKRGPFPAALVAVCLAAALSGLDVSAQETVRRLRSDGPNAQMLGQAQGIPPAPMPCASQPAAWAPGPAD
jgi:hypothetical protein